MQPTHAVAPDLLVKEAALAAATNGIVIADATRSELPILYANPGFERLTGYTADEILGRNCRFLQGPDTDPIAINELRAAVAEGRSAKVVVRNYRKDGSPF